MFKDLLGFKFMWSSEWLEAVEHMTRHFAELHGLSLPSKSNGCLLKGLKQEGSTHVTGHPEKVILVVVSGSRCGTRVVNLKGFVGKRWWLF